MTDRSSNLAAPSSTHSTGILWMLFAGLCFVIMTALVKITGDRIPPVEAAFLRYVLGVVFLVPMIRPLLRVKMTGRLWSLFLLRGGFHGAGVILWFFAMTQIPLAEVTAMNYLSPVYVSIGAVLVLGEKLAIRRITAIIAALIGAMIILRPGFREIEDGHLAMLLCAVVFAGSYLITKVLADEVPAAAVVAMLSLTVPVIMAPFALAVWITPTWTEIMLLFGVASVATMGHYAMTKAFSYAPVTVTQPVTFLQLVWATALGALFFAEPIDFWVVLGGSVILASVTFIAWREAVLKRRPITPPGPATKL